MSCLHKWLERDRLSCHTFRVVCAFCGEAANHPGDEIADASTPAFDDETDHTHDAGSANDAGRASVAGSAGDAGAMDAADVAAVSTTSAVPAASAARAQVVLVDHDLTPTQQHVAQHSNHMGAVACIRLLVLRLRLLQQQRVLLL